MNGQRLKLKIYNLCLTKESRPYLAGNSKGELLEYDNAEILLRDFIIDDMPLEKILKDIDVI